MAESQPLVSIVTPVYNGESFIRKSIESVLNQTYQNWDYLIQDNCCTDGTPEILEEFRNFDPRIRIERNSELLPANANWNLAFSKISEKSKFAQMLHADDSLHPDCLSLKVDLALQHPSIGMVGSLTEGGEKIWGEGLDTNLQLFKGHEIARDTLLSKVYPFLTPSVLLLRSDIVRARKPFYGDLIHSDVSACYDILQEWDFGMTHEVLSYVSFPEDNITARVAKPLNRLLITNLDLLLTYGPEFLNQQELDGAVSGRLRHYYRFLAQSLLEGRNTEFWDFHRQSMQEMSQPINRIRLYQNLISECISHPKASLWRLKQRLHPRAV